MKALEIFWEIVALFGYATISTIVGLFWTLGARIENTSALEILCLQLAMSIEMCFKTLCENFESP
jgi:hypothetical protein